LNSNQQAFWKNHKQIAKAVSAFANSDGGILVIGVEVNKKNSANIQTAKLVGLKESKDRTEWLETVIENKTFPSVSNYQVYQIISNNNERFYWINIGRSQTAPHQSEDKKYYKRNGSSSLAMENFEIEDVRSRVLKPNFPMVVRIEIDHGVFAELVVENTGSQSIRDCSFKLHSSFSVREHTKARLEGRGLNFLHSHQKANFFLGSLRDFLSIPESTLKIEFSYKLGSEFISDSIEFDFHDYNSQSIRRDPSEQIFENIEKAIVKLGDKLEAIDKRLSKISTAFSSSGLHLADSSLEVILGQEKTPRRKHDISTMDIEGLRDVLKITSEQAHEIHRRFTYFGGNSDWQTYFDSLPIDLQDRIKEKMEI
jgi:hypothetical protein